MPKDAALTVTYSPRDLKYFDDHDLRGELTRVYDLCHGCRLCLHLCPSFPTLFNFIDKRDGDVEGMSRAEQDQVVDECYQCKLCYVKCPYIPPHEWELDFPRLMMRAKAVRKVSHEQSLPERISDTILGNTDLIGIVSVPLAPLVNRTLAVDSTYARSVMQATLGIASTRVLPPYAKTRFSTWFNRRQRTFVKNRRYSVAIYPTCFVEYMDPEIGKATVEVYERNGISCSLPTGAKCCGAPWLHSGEVEKFVRIAKANVKALLPEVRAKRSIVIAQPTCAYVVKRDYPLYLGTQDATDVSQATYDTSEFLMKRYREDKESFDLDFKGEIPSDITYHAPCHLQAQNIGLKSRDVLKLTGAKITVVTKCSGIDGMWGYRAKNYQLSKKVAQGLTKAIEKAPKGVLVGDCHLANYGITEELSEAVSHPMVIMNKAYGSADK